MQRRDVVYLTGMIVIAALLIANLLRPTAPYAYDVKEGGPNIAISAAGESAWAIVGTKVYFISLKNRSDLPSTQRSINIIDSRAVE